MPKLNFFSGVKIYLILGSSVLWMSAVGCCTKKDCSGAGDAIHISFYDFLQTEVDSMVCYRYEKTGSFTNLLDSFRLRGSYYDSTNAVFEDYLPSYYNGIESKGAAGYDYSIRLSGTGSQILLTALETEKKGCNTCFPAPAYSDYYDVLKAYKVDGQRREGGSIEIHK